MGIFCKFGSDEANLPVDVVAIEKEEWILFVFWFKYVGKESEYVVLSFDSALHSSKSFGKSWPSLAKFSNTSALVDHEPVDVFFPPDNSSLSNNISPTCFGEPRLISSSINL